MSTSEDLLERIDAAVARIRAATDDDTPVDLEDHQVPLFRKVTRLSRANQSLSEQLSDLKEQRERDIAELDALVDELKPLIGEN